MSAPVIVGGGPAGAAAAIALARAGLAPILIERDAVAREKVCGEFLASDATDALDALGVDVVALGAVPIRRALFGAGPRVAELRLPFPAWGLPRACLDAALLAAAREAGATLRLGVAVRQAAAAPGGWQLLLGDGSVLRTGGFVLATGKHELRGVARAVRGGSLGLKLVLDGPAPDAAVTLLLCSGGYAGLQARPDGGANLCAALDPSAPGVAKAARSAEAFLAHVGAGSALAARLLGAMRPVAPKPMAVAGVPYGFVHRGGGPYRAGDQASVIASFCGDGVAMALASGVRAAGAVAAGTRAELHHAAWLRAVRGGMRLGSVLSMATRHAPGLLVAGAGVAPWIGAALARRTRLGGLDPMRRPGHTHGAATGPVRLEA